MPDKSGLLVGLPIEKTKNNIALNADSDCVVNYVEIIHDCIPRQVSLNFSFISHGDDSLYLRVRNMITIREVAWLLRL